GMVLSRIPSHCVPGAGGLSYAHGGVWYSFAGVRFNRIGFGRVGSAELPGPGCLSDLFGPAAIKLVRVALLHGGRRGRRRSARSGRGRPTRGRRRRGGRGTRVRVLRPNRPDNLDI